MTRGEIASERTGGAAAGLGYLEPHQALLWPPHGVQPRLRPAMRGRLLQRQLWAFVLLGAGAAAAVGYIVAQNPDAAPAHVAVPLRVAIILTLLAAGAFAQASGTRTRMGLLLLASSLYASLWLLNGSRDPLPFSIGMLLAGLGPVVFAFLILAYPSGRLSSSGERRLLIALGGTGFALWTFLVVTGAQPQIRTPLLACAPHCPSNPLFVGSAGADPASVARAGVWVTWTALACATPLLLFERLRRGAEPLRRSFIPLEIAAIVNAALWLAFLGSRFAGSKASSAFGAAYVETALGLPLAILAALIVERLSMGRALATFVHRLAEHPLQAPEALLSATLNDPSVEIAYSEPRSGLHVDSRGRPTRVPERGERRAVARIERAGVPIAAVGYDAELSDQAAFVEAAGAVALMHFEAARLEANLIKANSELAASRLRVIEAADNERQRIERDLHDGVQQHVLGLRLRLDLAAETLEADPARGERMISAIGRQVDELLTALRSFAAGIYPSVLTERGLKDALESAIRNVPLPISVHTFGLRRYPEDIEVSVYFCCLEAIQNVVKHAGPDPDARMRVWHVGDTLAFDLRDSGIGFDPLHSPPGNGLTNMRDRIEAIGGKLWVGSQPGRGTWVRGRVPLS